MGEAPQVFWKPRTVRKAAADIRRALYDIQVEKYDPQGVPVLTLMARLHAERHADLASGLGLLNTAKAVVHTRDSNVGLSERYILTSAAQRLLPQT